MTPEEITAGIEAAHQRGVLVRVISPTAAIQWRSMPGSTSSTTETVSMPWGSSAWSSWDLPRPEPALPVRFAAMMGGGGLGFTAAMAEDIERALAVLPKANEAGVKLLCGDDYGAISLPHGRYADELKFYVKEAGIPPLDVIRWATHNGADLLGRSARARVGAGGLPGRPARRRRRSLVRHRAPPGPGPAAGHPQGRDAREGRSRSSRHALRGRHYLPGQ